MSAAPRTATFRGWLVAQSDRPDAVGDLARDAAADQCWTTTGWQRFAYHILNEHGAEIAMDAAIRARTEYRAWFNGGGDT